MGRVTIEGVSYPDLTEFKVTVGSADVYSFRFAEPFGWAIFTINNATGEFNLQSDWGSWQFRWNISSLGSTSEAHEKPLAHFLGTSNDAHYVTDKLGYGEPRTFRSEFSEEKTRDEMRRLVLAARLQSDDISPEVCEWMEAQVKEATGRDLEDYGVSLDKETARRFWKEIGDWLSEHDMKTEAAQLMAIDDLRYRCEELYDFLTGKDKITRMCDRDIWELFEHEPSWGYTFLCQKLLPFFFAYLRDNVLKEPDAEEKKTA